MIAYYSSTLLVWVLLTLTALIATWVWVASKSPKKFAPGYIQFRFRERGLPAGDGFDELFADLAELAVKRAELLTSAENKGVRQLVHEESDAMLHVAELWHFGNAFMADGEAFRPILELLERHKYPKLR